MILIFENKGVLVPVYFVASVIATATAGRYLFEAMVGPIPASKSSFWIGFGFSCLITCVWIYLTKNDHYVDKNGVKKRMEIRNSFFFIKMEYWVYIFFILGIVGLISSLF